MDSSGRSIHELVFEMKKHACRWFLLAGFSLVEVVVALGVFSGAILVVIGLSSPLQRRVSGALDAEIAGNLVKNVESEIRRIGYSNLMASPLLPRLSAGASDPLFLYATADGNRVLLDIDAEKSLSTGNPRGMAERDRYFRIRVISEHSPDANAGWLSLRADVSWPYRIPAGPPTHDAASADQDPSEVIPETQRSDISYFFALAP